MEVLDDASPHFFVASHLFESTENWEIRKALEQEDLCSNPGLLLTGHKT